jgi:hypothetical protein
MWRFWLIGAMMTGTFLANWADAMLVKVPLEQLVKEADLIIVGRVESVKGQKREDWIFSLAELSVKEVLKGQMPPQGRVTVEFEGGQVGEEILMIEDSPNYKPGEEVVAFLHKLPNSDRYVTVEMLQGKYQIKEGTVVEENLPLDTFLKEIGTLVQKEKS